MKKYEGVLNLFPPPYIFHKGWYGIKHNPTKQIYPYVCIHTHTSIYIYIYIYIYTLSEVIKQITNFNNPNLVRKKISNFKQSILMSKQNLS